MADNINALQPVSTLPDKEEWGTIFRMAEQLVPTGFLPKAIDTPQKAAAILLKGRELGIAPMAALSGIAIINQKPTVMAELMVAMVKRAYGRDVIWVEESTDTHAKVGYLVHGKPRFYAYTIEMAQKANLTKNPTWSQHPAAMLRARTLSAVCRMEFPEVIGGMYVAGETGGAVTVDESTGEVSPVWDYEIPAPTPRSPQEEYAHQRKRFFAVMSQYGITEDERKAFIRHGKVASGSTKDMSAEQLAQAADYVSSRSNPKAFMAMVLKRSTESMKPIDNIGNRAISEPEPLEHETQVDPETGEIIPPAGSYQSEFIDMPDPVHAGHGEA